MPAEKNKMKDTEKIQLYGSIFRGHPDFYGTYTRIADDSGKVSSRQVKAPVTDKVIHGHLSGRQPYGIYLLVNDRTQAIAIDFDIQDLSLPLEFVDRARHYGLPAYIEISKSKGYHVWIFFDGPTSAKKARLVVLSILDEMDAPDTEVFPKQDELGADMYGNFINAPLFGALIKDNKTVFISSDTHVPFPDQWNFLKSVKKVTEKKLDEIIEINELSSAKQAKDVSPPDSKGQQFPRYGLPPCLKTMLAEGVRANQRVSCFRLAANLKRVGIPRDLAILMLLSWSFKNRPTMGKRKITHTEIIRQTSYAYSKAYDGYGCETEAVKAFLQAQLPFV